MSSKRKASVGEASSDSEEPKKKCVKIEDWISDKSIFSLSDDVLLGILKRLRSFDIINTSDTCIRLQTICADKSLWKAADFRGRGLGIKLLKKYLKNLNSETKSLAIEGCLNQRAGAAQIESLSEALLRDLKTKSPNLSTLILEKCFIDANKISFDMFPPTLQHLSVTNTEVINTPENASYFKDIGTLMPQIVTLDLSYSGWVPNHSLMAICKCPNLEELRLRGCFRMGECFAYTALACRFGFDKVTLFDFRDTEVGDIHTACFFGRPMVKTMLLGKDSGDNTDSKITDRSISGSSSSTILEMLSLRNTKITDAGLKSICEKFPSLKKCDVRGTSVTKECVEESRKRLAKCQVLSDV